MKISGSGVKFLGFKFWLCHWLAVSWLARRNISNLRYIDDTTLMAEIEELKSLLMKLLTKVRLVKAMVFPVVVYGCESWTIKKAEVLKN